MRLKRVIAAWTDVEDPSEDRITVDVFCDEDNVAHAPMMMFGFMGGAAERSSSFMPFGVRTNGTIANWRQDELDESDEQLLLVGREMTVGQYITYREDGEDFTYRILQVIDPEEM